MPEFKSKSVQHAGGGGASAPGEPEPMSAPGAPAPEWTDPAINPHLRRAGTHRGRRRRGKIGETLEEDDEGNKP